MGWLGPLVAGQSTEARRHWRRFAGALVIRFGAGGSPTPVRLDGSAAITNRVELSINDDLLVARIGQVIDARARCAPTQAEACRKRRRAPAEGVMF